MRRTVDLSIDFDFFIRELPEWDFWHSEHRSVALDSILWDIRYKNLDLHTETDPARWADFLPMDLFAALRTKNIHVPRDGFRRLSVADSHRWGYAWWRGQRRKADVLLSLDAHHDLWPIPAKGPDCASWLTGLLEDVVPPAETVVAYPSWKLPSDDGTPAATPTVLAQWKEWPGFATPVELRNVFLCRSAAWVPPHHDPLFLAFALDLKDRARTFHEMEKLLYRPHLSPEEASATRAAYRTMMENLTHAQDHR